MYGEQFAATISPMQQHVLFATCSDLGTYVYTFVNNYVATKETARFVGRHSGLVDLARERDFVDVQFWVWVHGTHAVWSYSTKRKTIRNKIIFIRTEQQKYS